MSSYLTLNYWFSIKVFQNPKNNFKLLDNIFQKSKI